MNQRIVLTTLFLFLRGASPAQYLPALWNFHAPGNSGLVSEMLYPAEQVRRPYIGAAFSTLPGLTSTSAGFLCYHQPLPQYQASFQGMASFLNVGPYQEFSFKLQLARQFGTSLYVYLQPEYQQLRVRAYGSRGSLAYAVALAYKQGSWLFAFYGQQQLGGETRSPFLQMAWNYGFSEKLRLGLSLKKLPFYSWQTLVSIDYAPDKKQSFHVALSHGPGCLVGYERLRSKCRIRLGLAYSAMGGLYPENAMRYGW